MTFIFLLIRMEGKLSYQRLITHSTPISILKDLGSAHNFLPASSISPSLQDNSHKLTKFKYDLYLNKIKPYFMNHHLSQPWSFSFQVNYHQHHTIHQIVYHFLTSLQYIHCQVPIYPRQISF